MFDLNFVDNIKSYLKQNKMENEFLILKTIKNNKLDFVYKVEEKNSKKIYCIKKIYKNSKKNDINNTKKLFNDMLTKNQFRNNIINDNHFLLGYDFCNHYKDFWIEDENFVLNYNNLFMPEKYLYILYDYYPNGDLLDYLEKLEKIEYKFTPDFYWDIIFEMIMGLKYFHELGYLHLDIKPTNFLVDQKGYLKLTDFGLCHKISEIPFLTDIIEGDKIYISKELFNFNSQGILNTKTDVFSLGLSILEIIAKINLPSSGESWAELRSDNFQIKEKLLENWNINENKDKFVNLISRMITPIDKRADLGELIKNFEELNKRYELLINNKYKKSGEIPELNNIINCKVNIIHID
jgi:serine/threonine protein kinase